jgi:AsmA protein
MQKRWVKITAAAAGLFVLVVILVPFLVHADTFRPTLENQLSSALGRKITLGHLSFSLLGGSIVAENISIADDPAFSSSPFLEAKSLSIGVKIAPLIFSRQVSITKLTIDTPSIHLLHGQKGVWNFSSIGGAATTTQSPQQASAIPNLTVGELIIKNGSASVSSTPAVRKALVYSAINVTVKQFSFAKSFPFELSAKLPASGSFELKGDAGPLSQSNAADTPFNATLQVKGFDPVAAGVVDPSEGISMVADIDAQLVSDGTSLNGNGKIKAAKLQLSRSGSPAPEPINIDYSISDNLDAEAGQISNISVQAGAAAARVSGTYRITPQAIVVDLHLATPNLPIDELEHLLPAVGIRLPSGSALRGGTLTANLDVTGPATAPTISGPAEIDNTKLAGYDLGTKIQGMNPFAGKGGGTEIQTLRATLNSSPELTRISSIYGNLPQIGTATGDGTIAPSGALDFKMVATFASSTGVGAVANEAVSAVSGIGSIAGKLRHPKTKTTANKGIPLTVTGTTSNPNIRANFGAMLK